MDRKEWYWNVYLRSDHWRDFRKMYFDLYGTVKCDLCRCEGGLHLHHKTYERLGGECLADVVPLCEHCHSGTTSG